MRGELTRQINVRLDVSTIEKINDLIRDGEFSNMADFLRYSVNMMLKSYLGRSPPPLGAEKVKIPAGG
jgi:Arc/MetJ-type ribon-helix-helix transcriptional regulator